MRLRAAAIAPLVVLAACVGEGDALPRTVTFLCPDGAVLLATFYPEDERMQLRVSGREYDLPRLISASGARYGEGRTVFWNKGREALLQRRDGPSFVGCLAVP